MIVLRLLLETKETLSKYVLLLSISEANRQARYLGNTNQFFSRTPNRYSRSEYIGTDLDPASDKVRLKMEQMSADLAKGSKYTTEFNAAQGKMYATIDRGSGVLKNIN